MPRSPGRTTGALTALLATSLIACGSSSAQQPPDPGAQPPTSFGNALGTLRLPEALALTANGDVLVGDHYSGRIQRFRDGVAVGAFGLYGDGCGRLNAVGGIATGPGGDVYVVDSDHQLVQVFGADGKVKRCFGGRGRGPGDLDTGSGSFAGSSAGGGIAVTSKHVYVADTGRHRIVRFNLDGTSPRTLGRGRLKLPQGIAIKGNRMLVADDGSHRVIEMTTSGKVVRASKVKLKFPYDVALTKSGNVYVADNNGHRIVELDRSLRQVRAWGREGSSAGRFRFPRALALTKSGDVLVADAANNRVQQFSASGKYKRSLGGDGRAEGRLTTPASVAVNAMGEVAIGDANGRVAWTDLRGKWLGGWAQSKSFEESSATVYQPTGVHFAPDDRQLRVVDGGRLLTMRAGAVGSLLERPDVLQPIWKESDRIRAITPGAGPGTSWVLTDEGTIREVSADGKVGPAVGPPVGPDEVRPAIALAGDGVIAVSERTADYRPKPADGRILFLTPEGRELRSVVIRRPSGGNATRPAGLAPDGSGGLWVSDAANDRILHLDAAGATVATLGRAGAGEGELAEPRGLAIDCEGGLLVADSGNSRIVRFPGVAVASGCQPVPARATGADGPPPPVGLRARARTRPTGFTASLGSVSATCARKCTLSARAQAGVANGTKFSSVALTATATNGVIKVTASEADLKAMRKGERVSIVVAVTATAPGGVIDTATVGMRMPGRS